MLSTNKGSALLTALLVVSLVAAISTGLLLHGRQDIERTDVLFTADRAYLQAQGVEAWAIGVLRQSDQRLTNSWPKQLPQTSIPGGSIAGTLDDWQSRFNLNSLVDSSKKTTLIRLLQIVAPDINAGKAMLLAQALSYWVTDPKFTPVDKNCDTSYALQDPSYHCAKRTMKSISELLLVQNMTPELYQLLMNNIAVWPVPQGASTQQNNGSNNPGGQTNNGANGGNNDSGSSVGEAPESSEVSGGSGSSGTSAQSDSTNASQLSTVANTNTALAPVLAAINNSMTLEQAQNKVEQRQKSLTEENSHMNFSQYFLLQTDIQLNDQHLTVYTLMQRKVTEANHAADVIVMWRSIGTL